MGDVVPCRYDADARKVELVLEGDPRFDPKLKKASAKAQRDALLKGTPGAAPTAGGYQPLDPELQALMNADEAERRGQTPAPTATSSSRLDQLKQLGELRDQGVLSDAEFEQEKSRILAEQ